MDLLFFSERFPDDAFCKNHFKEIREDYGITCSDPECGSASHYWLESVEMWQCMDNLCRRRVRIKGQTILHGSKLSFHHWYYMAYCFLVFPQKPMQQIQRDLSLKRYAPVWAAYKRIKKYKPEGFMVRIFSDISGDTTIESQRSRILGENLKGEKLSFEEWKDLNYKFYPNFGFYKRGENWYSEEDVEKAYVWYYKK